MPFYIRHVVWLLAKDSIEISGMLKAQINQTLHIQKKLKKFKM